MPTTQISLIREHTEFIRPPRALWVPFELGRPLGGPDNPPLQRRILMAALDLFQAAAGPVLHDFPDEDTEADEGPVASVAWACPVNFALAVHNKTDIEKMIAAFDLEIMELRPWYDIGLLRRDRTAVGAFPPPTAGEMLVGYLSGEVPDGLKANLSLPVALRLAAQDLKTFYFEAVLAKPGLSPLDSTRFTDWFWQETAAGQILKAVREKCLTETDNALRFAGKLLLVPMNQL